MAAKSIANKLKDLRGELGELYEKTGLDSIKPGKEGGGDIKGERSFSRWLREELPDKKFLVSNIDFVLEDWQTKTLMLLEMKTYKKTIRPAQRILYENLCRWIRKGMEPQWKLIGWFTITFEKSCFDDGKCWINDVEVTEDQLLTYIYGEMRPDELDDEDEEEESDNE